MFPFLNGNIPLNYHKISIEIIILYSVRNNMDITKRSEPEERVQIKRYATCDSRRIRIDVRSFGIDQVIVPRECIESHR